MSLDSAAGLVETGSGGPRSIRLAVATVVSPALVLPSAGRRCD